MPTIQNKRTTAANWTARNTVLAAGETGFETDTRRWKIGDGTTAWNSLPYGAGNVTDGNKGDITVSGAGETWTINAGAVVTADLADGAVTNAKVTSITASKVSDFASAVVAASPEEVVEFLTTANFPAIGNSSLLYRATDAGRLFAWTGSQYAEVGPTSSSGARRGVSLGRVLALS